MTWFLSIPPARLRCMVQNARSVAKREYQRGELWPLVSRIFGVGCTSAIEICKLAELDPHELVRSRPTNAHRPGPQYVVRNGMERDIPSAPASEPHGDKCP